LGAEEMRKMSKNNVRGETPRDKLENLDMTDPQVHIALALYNLADVIGDFGEGALHLLDERMGDLLLVDEDDGDEEDDGDLGGGY
jgi:hypothetical protein